MEEWVSLEQFINEKSQKMTIQKVHYWNASFIQNDFFLLYSEELEESTRKFSSATDFFNYLLMNKMVDKNNLVFLLLKDKQYLYKCYFEIVQDKRYLEDVVAIKLRKENRILWKIKKQTFDTKASLK